MEEKNEINELIKALPDETRALALRTADEYFYFIDLMDELRPLPKIRTSAKNPAIQKITPAGKLIKEYSQVVDAKRATLLRIFGRSDTSDADSLAEILKQYE